MVLLTSAIVQMRMAMRVTCVDSVEDTPVRYERRFGMFGLPFLVLRETGYIPVRCKATGSQGRVVVSSFPRWWRWRSQTRSC